MQWKLLSAALIFSQSVCHAAELSKQEKENLLSLPYANGSGQAADADHTGVTVYNKKLSGAGYNVLTDFESHAFLMDPSGNVVHEWEFRECKRWQYARVLPNGEVLGLCVNQGIFRIDQKGHKDWIYQAPAHHDVDVQANGGILTLGWAGTYPHNGRKVRFETVEFLRGDGVPVETWSTWDNLPEIKRHHFPSPLDSEPPLQSPERSETWEYYHANAVHELRPNALGRTDPRFQPGNILISLRNACLIAILDKTTKHIVWAFGPGILDNQHTPVMNEDGHILLFDNGMNRGYSRVIEIDPVRKKIVWRYPPEGTPAFFSKKRGSAQRLENGNTLICDGDNGRAFEVTPEGKTVWEFWNPFFESNGDRRHLYRMERLPRLDPAVFHLHKPIPIEKFVTPQR